ncbi:MAG: hypothetical protein Tsb009_27760 [Planctomycetaceae bacterium]
MSHVYSWRWTKQVFRLVLLALVCGLVAGCGGGDVDENPASQTAQNNGNAQKTTAENGKSSKLPPASIKGDAPKKKAVAPPPKKGTPQWYVHEMLVTRFQKYPEKATVEQLKKLRRDRNLKIIKLAEEAIPLTAKDPKLEEVFNAVIHQLLESRVALAMEGKEDDIFALYDLADILYKRDKKSKAAAEAAYRVAAFANQNALRDSDPKQEWLAEFTRRARLFATNFPQEQARAVRLLDAAGRSCEYHRKIPEAISCYQQLRQQFPDLLQAKRATAVLRRLQLQGKPLILKGPSIDGGFVDIQDSRNKVVLVVFWATGQKQFDDIVPKLKAVRKSFSLTQLDIIGVNLDKEELAVDAYLEKTGMNWPHIFYPDRKKRGWENLIAKYYAIRSIPTLWLIDKNGNVANLYADPDKLESQIRTLLTRRTASRSP